MTQEEFVLALEDLGLKATPNQLSQLEKFYQFLIETNKTMNLTRIVEKKDVYLKHFYDSLTIAKICDLKEYHTLCDIGSGAGFPGVVLKIFYPNLKITLIDSLQKRVNYLNELIEKLELKDIIAYHIRAEDLALKKEKFDVVTARAVASLPKLLSIAMPLVNKNGIFVAMKGNVEEELEKSKKVLTDKHYKLVKKEQFLLPIENSQRSLLLFIMNK